MKLHGWKGTKQKNLKQWMTQKYLRNESKGLGRWNKEKNKKELHISDDDHQFDYTHPHWVWSNETKLNHFSVLQLETGNTKEALQIQPFLHKIW